MIIYLIGCLVSAILLFIYYWKYNKRYELSDVPISIFMILISWISIVIEIGILGIICMEYVEKHWTKVLWESKDK